MAALDELGLPKKISYNDIPEKYRNMKFGPKHFNLVETKKKLAPDTLLIARYMVSEDEFIAKSITTGDNRYTKYALYITENPNENLFGEKMINILKTVNMQKSKKFTTIDGEEHTISLEDFENLSKYPSTIGINNDMLQNLEAKIGNTKRYHDILDKLEKQTEKDVIKGKINKEEYDDVMELIAQKKQEVIYTPLEQNQIPYKIVGPKPKKQTIKPYAYQKIRRKK